MRPGPASLVLGAGLLAGVALGAALGALGRDDAPSAAVAPALASAAPRAPRSGPAEPLEPPEAQLAPAPLVDGACAAADAVCDAHMRAIGCTPPAPFPEDLPEEYTPAAVHRTFEELRRSCPSLAESLLQVDCSEYPCLLFLPPSPTDGDFSLSREERVQGTRRWPEQVTCGRHGREGGLNIELTATWNKPGTHVESDVYAIHPDAELPFDLHLRARDRVASYSVEEMEALDAR